MSESTTSLSVSAKPSKPMLWDMYLFKDGGSVYAGSNVLQFSITVSLYLGRQSLHFLKCTQIHKQREVVGMSWLFYKRYP